MSMDIGEQMEFQQLRDENSRMRTVVSRSINILEQVKIALEEDDTEEALRIVQEATAS